MSKQNVVHCEHLMSNMYCDAIAADEGKRVREESCCNELKNLCCYLCNIREKCEISCVFLDVVPSEVANVVVLAEGEKVVQFWTGNVERASRANARGVKDRTYGTLLLTNRRLVWVAQKGDSRCLEFEVPLEKVLEVVGGDIEGSFRDASMDYHFRFNQESDADFAFLAESEIQKRGKEIEVETARETVDFSQVRDYMGKGGTTLQAIKCLECGARVNLPETGRQTVCENCGNTLYAQDVLQRIKDLIG